MAFTLPNLPYAHDALEPHIDTLTMQIHHGKHHQAYITNLNNAIAGTDMENKSLDELLKMAGSNTVVRNNGGGHWNHTFFWGILSPQGGGQPSGALADAINTAFGSFETFKDTFAKAAVSRFGSGWAWLGVKPNGSLCVCSTPNQDNPLMDIAECACQPILGIDVWEHAYYLNYQNRRPDYINAFFNVVNWEAVAANYAQAVK